MRPGDPLSPYLFIIAELILSVKVEALWLESFIVPISSVHSTRCRLLYTDDIMLFLKVFKRSLCRLKALLSKYQESSEQLFNLQKRQLFVGRRSVRGANMIAGLLPIPQATLPLVYLSVPLFFGSPRQVFPSNFGNHMI